MTAAQAWLEMMLSARQVASVIYRKIKTSQGNIFTDPMASGGGLTDLILRCLVFGAVSLRKVSSWLLIVLRTRKKGRGARRSPTTFKSRAWEDRDTREL